MLTAIQDWVQRIRAGEVRALARAISVIEDNTPEAGHLLKALFPFSGKARVIGLTGAPGAGKSTLVDQLAREYRKQGRTVGIIVAGRVGDITGHGRDHRGRPNQSLYGWRDSWRPHSHASPPCRFGHLHP